MERFTGAVEVEEGGRVADEAEVDIDDDANVPDDVEDDVEDVLDENAGEEELAVELEAEPVVLDDKVGGGSPTDDGRGGSGDSDAGPFEGAEEEADEVIDPFDCRSAGGKVCGSSAAPLRLPRLRFLLKVG